jgi:hypothetical protein
VTLPTRRVRHRALLFAPVTLTLAAQSTGPTSADLRGTVTSGGRPASGAQVRLLREGTGEVRTVQAGADGTYLLRLLAPGRYRMDVSAGGEASWTTRGLDLAVGTTAQVDVRLGDAGAKVEVAAAGELADPTRTMAATVVGPELIAGLPISRRSFSDFALTTPAVALNNAPVNDGAPSSRLTVNGMPARQNNFMLDGLDNNDLGGGAIRSGISQEAVQEFQVITGAYGVEHGRALGGLVNTVTKSGTNAFTGSAFYYLRPGSLAADRPDLDLHQYGATAGGAFLKDRLFYIAAFERLRKTDENEVAITPATASAVRAAGFQLQTGKLPFDETAFNVLLRLDWVQSAASRFTLRYLYSGEEDGNAVRWGGLVARSAGAERRTADRTLTLSHQSVGERFVNEAKLMRSRRSSTLDSLDTANTVFVEILGAASFGTQRLSNQASTVTYTQVADTLTAVLGAHTLKAGVDLFRAENTATVPQNFSGLYRFQALDLRPFGVPIFFPTSLDAFTAPNPFGGTGFPVAFVQSYGNPRASYTSRSEAAFLQDEWQVTPALLIRAGLRWERQAFPAFPDTADYRDLQNPPAVSIPGAGPVQLPAGAPLGGYDYPANFRVHRDWTSSLVSPRVHLSWQAMPALRAYGGWGRYSGPVNQGPIYGIRLYNGADVRTVIRTFIDPPLQSPMITWANADGVAQNRRYASAPAGPTTFVVPGDVAMPRMDMASAGLEWNPAPAHQVVLEAVQSRGRGFLNVRDVNAYVLYVNPAAGVPAPIQRRPDLRYSTLNRADGSGETRHESQSLAWTWKPDARLLVKASYTHSRTRDNFIDWTADFTPQNTFDPGSEWGPSVQDQRHRFVGSGVWQSGDRASAWTRNWTLGWIATWASGRPYTKLAGYDRNYDGDGTSDRPEGVGRNSETLPSTARVDLRAGRSFRLGEARLEATLEVFNLFNKGNVLEVQNNTTSAQPAYGTPVRFADRRQLQFGLRYSF